MNAIIERELFELIQVTTRKWKREVDLDTERFINDLIEHKEDTIRYYFNPAQYNSEMMQCILLYIVQRSKEITDCQRACIMEMHPGKWYFEVNSKNSEAV